MRVFQITMVLAALATPAGAADRFDALKHLLFLTTFDDTTDVNLFGPDNDAGWIYTAESPRRATTLMNNRCESVTIAKGQGKMRDCLRFGEQTRRVLYYQASPNLPFPRANWSGSLSFWLKPDLARLGPRPSYPLQYFDGNWNRGGFFLRFPNVSRDTFELGVVGSDPNVAGSLKLEQIPSSQKHIIAIRQAPFRNDEWTFVGITYKNVNPARAGVSTARLYLDGKIVGQLETPLRVQWMHPDERNVKQNAAMFLGINYVGDIDDLRLYNKALTRAEMMALFLK